MPAAAWGRVRGRGAGERAGARPARQTRFRRPRDETALLTVHARTHARARAPFSPAVPLRRCRRLVAAPARSSRALSLVAHRRRQDFLEKQHDAHEGEGEAYVPPLTLRQKAEIAAEREAEENARRGPPLPAGYSRDEDSKLIFEMSKKMNQRLNPGYTIAPHAATSKADCCGCHDRAFLLKNSFFSQLKYRRFLLPFEV